MMLALFWISLIVLFYCYIGYGMVAMLVSFLRRIFLKATVPGAEQLIPVTLVVTAYNEEPVLESKISNILALDYPRELLHVIFVTDGSLDRSVELIGQHAFITLLHQPERKGKYSAIRRAMERVETPVAIFSDANTSLNRECIRRIVSHYKDPRVGGVAGEKKILLSEKNTAVGVAEGLYWKYESFMKRMDAGLSTVVGAAGELFSIRTDLFIPTGGDLILDDFVISMQVCLQGYKIEYEPGAFASELPSASIAEEEKRKIRISAGAYQSLGLLKGALNFIRHPLLSFQYISRRVLRWVFGPIFLPCLFFSNLYIISTAPHAAFFTVFFYGQLSLYLMAILGGILVRAGKSAGIFTIPFYFLFMNFCLAKGFGRFINRKQSALWEKSLRQAVE